jgi:hypothetical protein
MGWTRITYQMHGPDARKVVLMKLLSAMLVLLTLAGLPGCANDPANDGRYATHDHGRNNHP